MEQIKSIMQDGDISKCGDGLLFNPFNPDNKEISGDEKKTIASVINGAFTRWETRKRIDSAIELLNVQNIKPTNRAVAKLIGMSVDTIGDRKKDPPIDMDYEVSLFN